MALRGRLLATVVAVSCVVGPGAAVPPQCAQQAAVGAPPKTGTAISAFGLVGHLLIDAAFPSSRNYKT